MSNEFQIMVRMLGTDIDGSLKVPYGIRRIKGVGIRLGQAITKAAGIDPDQRIGFLTDHQIQRLEEVIKDPVTAGVPRWMVNRPRDPATGKDLNLHGSDLEFQIRQDIEKEIKMKSWRGVRHSLGLKVRGQRTRTTGRKQAALGVSKKLIKAAKREK